MLRAAASGSQAGFDKNRQTRPAPSLKGLSVSRAVKILCGGRRRPSSRGAACPRIKFSLKPLTRGWALAEVRRFLPPRLSPAAAAFSPAAPGASCAAALPAASCTSRAEVSRGLLKQRPAARRGRGLLTPFSLPLLGLQHFFPYRPFLPQISLVLDGASPFPAGIPPGYIPGADRFRECARFAPSILPS